MPEISRRNFLIKSSITMGTVIGTCVTAGSIIAPDNSFAAQTDFLQMNCGGEGRKILVAYSSMCGSTGGVAKTIGEVFCKNGARTEVLFIDNVKDLSGYDGVVIGSAVRSSSWHKKAIEFVSGHQNTLKKIPVVYFLTCLALVNENEKTHEIAMGYFSPVLKAVPEIKPVNMEAFSGKLDYSKMNFMFRTIMKSKMKEKGVQEGDYRNYDRIKSWAQNQALPLLVNV